MFATTFRFLGGYALSRRDLRLLYAATLLSFLGTSMTFPLRMLYAQAHHASAAELGMMASVFLIGTLIAQLPMGWLVDRWGRVPVLLLGLIFHAILAILYIPLNRPIELIVLRCLEGVAVSGARPAISAYIADVTPEKHRSEAYGALAATLNVGMLLGPLVGGLIAQQFGFATAFFVNFLIEALAIPLVFGHVHEPEVHQEHEREEGDVSWRGLFSVPLIGAYAAMFSVQLAFAVLGALWAIWIKSLGGSVTFIGVTFSVFALPQIFLGTGAGRAADRWGRVPIILTAGLIAAGCYVSYAYIDNLLAITLLGIVEGMAIVFLQPITQSLLADASPASGRGRAQGLSGAVSAMGGAAAAFIALPLFEYSRPIPFIGAGVVMVVGSAIAAVGVVAYNRRRDDAVQAVSRVSA